MGAAYGACLAPELLLGETRSLLVLSHFSVAQISHLSCRQFLSQARSIAAAVRGQLANHGVKGELCFSELPGACRWGRGPGGTCAAVPLWRLWSPASVLQQPGDLLGNEQLVRKEKGPREEAKAPVMGEKNFCSSWAAPKLCSWAKFTSWCRFKLSSQGLPSPWLHVLPSPVNLQRECSQGHNQPLEAIL